MKLALVCLLAISLGVSHAYRSKSTADDSDKSTELKTDAFDTILTLIKFWLCKPVDKEGKTENSDDLFQMIIDLARIFLCEDGKSSK